jgi:peroxiredoxin
MDWLLIFLRALLAGVFLAAAIAKLEDRAGSTRTLVAFGFRAQTSLHLALAIPIMELTAVGLLSFSHVALEGVLLSLLLLLAFSVVMFMGILRGQYVPCNCFGSTRFDHGARASLLRNAALIAAAALLLVLLALQEGSFTRPHAFAFACGSGLFIAILVGVTAAIPKSLDATDSDSERAEGLRLSSTSLLGASAPAFELPDLHGEQHSLESLTSHGKPLLLIFLSPDCEECMRLLPYVPNWTKGNADLLSFAIMSRGSSEDNRSKFAGISEETLLLQPDRLIAETYGARMTPSAVLIDQNMRFLSELKLGPDGIDQLIATAKAIA